MTTAHKRATLTAKLTPGKDDDLLDWLDALPNGVKNTTIKNTLRAGMGLAPVDYSADDLDALRQQLDALQQAVAAIPALVKHASIDGAAERLAVVETELGRVGEWLNYLNARVEQATSDPALLPPSPPAEETQQLDTSALDARAAKLKRNQW